MRQDQPPRKICDFGMTPVTSSSLVPTSTSNESHTRSVELRARSRYAVQRVSHSFRRASRSFQILTTHESHTPVDELRARSRFATHGRDRQRTGTTDDPMRDDVDGDEAMVPRVPNLPPEPSARQIAEHELTGHAVYRSWCRHCVASKGRAHAHSSREEGELPEIGIDLASLVVTEKMCCQSCVSSVGTVQPDAWERQLLTGRERQITRVHF